MVEESVELSHSAMLLFAWKIAYNFFFQLEARGPQKVSKVRGPVPWHGRPPLKTAPGYCSAFVVFEMMYCNAVSCKNALIMFQRRLILLLFLLKYFGSTPELPTLIRKHQNQMPYRLCKLSMSSIHTQF